MLKSIRENGLQIAFVIFMFVLTPMGVYYADKADKADAKEAFEIWERAYGNPNGITQEEFKQLKNYQRRGGPN